MRPILAALLALAPLTAQQNVVYNLPTPQNSTNAFPFGSLGIRYQCLFSNAQLGSTPAWVQDVFHANIPAATATEVIYDDIEIRMGMTPATTLTSAWATNNPNPVTVYRGYLRVIFQPNVWGGFGLPGSFLYLPLPAAPNLCLEVIVWAVRGQAVATNFMQLPADGTLQRAFLFNWTGTQGVANTGTGGAKIGLLLNGGNWSVVGRGCNSSASTPLTISGPASAWPTRGVLFPIGLTGGAVGRASFLQLGASDTSWSGVPLPFDLGLINAPGCTAWNDALISFGTATDASGSASFPLVAPNTNALAGLRLFAYWAHLDPGANPFGLATSGQMKLIFDH